MHHSREMWGPFYPMEPLESEMSIPSSLFAFTVIRFKRCLHAYISSVTCFDR